MAGYYDEVLKGCRRGEIESIVRRGSGDDEGREVGSCERRGRRCRNRSRKEAVALDNENEQQRER